MTTPYRLRCWELRDLLEPNWLFTCGRPGREKGRGGEVPDKLVHDWVDRLPGHKRTAIVSLLGHKPDGTSEYDFYPSFRGKEDASERPNVPHFGDWLAREYPDREFFLEEYPTKDFKAIPDDQLRAISELVKELLETGRTVVLVDSGGEQRTGAVCRYMGLHMGLRENTSWLHDQS
jgi:hypothetical protein